MTELNLSTPKSSCTVIPERGGLISSLKFKGRELLWMPESFSAQDSSWPGGGLPLCFPFAGRVWHQGQLYQYGLGGVAYPMPLHGFAYGATWNVITSSQFEAILELRDSERSRDIFPFSFRVTMTLRLTDASLRIDVHVAHMKAVAGSPKMPVALGFHPYFKLEDAKQTSLTLEAKKYYPVTPVGAAGKVASCEDLGPQPWNIQAPLLNSLILSDISGGSIATLQCGQNRTKMKSGPNAMFQHIVVWTNRPQEFYCVEPWMSLPDAVATPSGCQWLGEGEELKGFLEISG